MIRVIAGSARGQKLVAPRGLGVRPTPAKVREALFGILTPRLPGAAVLDLFCGIGALGIEALSRGAARATFVDRDGRSLRYTRDNLERTGLIDRAQLVRRRLPEQLGDVLGGPYDLVFSDPPYADDVRRPVARALLATPGLLASDAIWVHELSSRDLPEVVEVDGLETLSEPVQGWQLATVRRYGDTGLVVMRVGAPGS